MTDIFNKFKLDGSVAIVTGGAGMLGRGFCRTLSEAGAAVVVADKNKGQADQVADEISKTGKSLALEVDVTGAESVRAMAAETKKAFGRLDILVYSAALDPKFDPHLGGSYERDFEHYPLENWQRALDVNLTGAFLSAQAAAPLMLEHDKGVMVMISSIYGLAGPDQRIYQHPDKPRQFKPADYAVSKAGLLGLTRHLAAYYAGRNIRVNALSPGGVFNGHEDKFVREYTARTILGRMADRDEMNAALLFLASDASSYMTGSNLVVDGGWTAW
jgi:2-deoxy-D-gluconate 3-dehydrogenase